MEVSGGPRLVGFDDQSIKKGFIRKVYSILSLQLLFTCAMCAVFMLVQPAQQWVLANRWMIWVMLVCAIITIFPMMKWRKEYHTPTPYILTVFLYQFDPHVRYPRNMICLALFTMFESYTVAFICAAYAAQGNAATGLHYGSRLQSLFFFITAVPSPHVPQ